MNTNKQEKETESLLGASRTSKGGEIQRATPPAVTTRKEREREMDKN
jgi:hypothetical protein